MANFSLLTKRFISATLVFSMLSPSGAVYASPEAILAGELSRTEDKRSCGKRVCFGAAAQTYQQLQEDAERVSSIASDLKAGRCDRLMSEAVDAFLIELSGDSTLYYKSKRGEFNQLTLELAADALMGRFFAYMNGVVNKRSDIYGVTPSGERVTIFEDGKTLFGRFANYVLPSQLPLRGALVKAFNVGLIENQVKAKLRDLGIDFLRQLAEARGMTLKEATGSALAAPVNAALGSGCPADIAQEAAEDDSQPVVVLRSIGRSEAVNVEDDEDDEDDEAFDQAQQVPQVSEDSPLWTYMAPHLTHYLRDFLMATFTGVRTTLYQQADKSLRPKVVGLGGACGFALGPIALTSAGTLLGLTVSGGPFALLAAAMANPTVAFSIGSGLGTFLGMNYATSAYQQTEHELTKTSDAQVEGLLYKVLGYSPEEHALYALNEKPSAIERAVFAEDYRQRDDLKGRYLTVALIKELYRLSKLNYFAGQFGEIDRNSSDEDIRFAFNLDQFTGSEQALQHNVEQNALRKFYALPDDQRQAVLESMRQHPSYKMKRAQLTGEALEGDAETDAKEKARLLKEVVEAMVGENGDERAQAVFNAVFDDLSIEEQDVVLGVWERSPGSFASVNSDEDPKDALKRIIRQANANYIAAHQDALKKLGHHSICTGMSEADVVKMHKMLVQKNPTALTEFLNEADFEEDSVAEDGFSLVDRVLDFAGPDVGLQNLRDYHRSLVAKQTTVFLMNTLKSQVEAHGVMDQVRAQYDSDRDLYTGVRAVKLLIVGNEAFETILRPIRAIKEGRGNAVKAVFRGQFNHYVTELAREILGHADDDGVVISMPREDNPSFLDQAPLEAQLQKALRLPEVYEGDEDACGELNLSNRIKFFEAQKPEAAQKSYAEYTNADLKALYTHIIAEKEARLPDHYKRFLAAHQKEMGAFIGKNSQYRGRLFYSLVSAIDAKRQANFEFLRGLFPRGE